MDDLEPVAVKLLRSGKQLDIEWLFSKFKSEARQLARLEGFADSDSEQITLAADACRRVWAASKPSGISQGHRKEFLNWVQRIFGTRKSIRRLAEALDRYHRAPIKERLGMLKRAERERILQEMARLGNCALASSGPRRQRRNDDRATLGTPLWYLEDLQTWLVKKITFYVDDDHCDFSAIGIEIPDAIDRDACWKAWGRVQKSIWPAESQRTLPPAPEKVPVRANKKVIFSGKEPTPDVKDLAFLLANRGEKSKVAVATEFHQGNEAKAQSSLSQIRRLERRDRIKFMD